MREGEDVCIEFHEEKRNNKMDRMNRMERDLTTKEHEEERIENRKWLMVNGGEKGMDRCLICLGIF